ncbi:7TM receptor with intracellular HD hydrolase [Prevotella disiens JCM 6334 = ATCC 29426]|uniref:Predicted HD superfamily hydrolase n=2 Tax=Prevotella disiens TaxID=28130 RepID=A0A379DX93_9BACT|nr:HDIG domain-containing metalloprotein [Prevotella disiens]ERJ77446.1 7TM receptor with intracellular HD hydrolase [Prevotella disiens JCM 6334 = ATCC 29426]SUB84780.1 Predicted HD superfamily hydrolase [Prevotella disiens]
MIKFNNQNNKLLQSFVSRIVLVVLTVALIVALLPRSQGKMFHYDEGKPWMYGQLIAKFDFPIFKSEETLKNERDSIMKNFRPYFNVNPKIEEQKIGQFLKDYKNGIPGLPPEYVTLVAQRLHELYQMGIANTAYFTDLQKDSNNVVHIVMGKQAISKPVGEIYTTLGAYENLFSTPQLSAKRSIIQQCNLNEYIEANLQYDKARSESEMNDMLSLIPQASGMVLEGQRIIDRGDIVDAKTYRVLDSFEQATEKRNESKDQVTSMLIGQSLYVFILLSLFTLYLTLFRNDYFEKPRAISLLYAMLIIFSIITSVMMKHNIFSVYIVPFAMAPIFVRVFMDSRTAFVSHVTMIFLCAVAVKYQYEFIIVQLVAGLIAIYSLRELSKRSQIFLTALLVTVGSAAAYLSLQLIQNDDFSKLDHSMYYHLAVNGIFLLFTYPLMLIIEKLFGFISTVTMFELSNTNNELLRTLSEVAPGTFQHSMTVGNLGVEIANKIHAKGHLVRTGALYHDIGKMVNPVFFTENQVGVNPHDNISDLESAKIIIGHVTEGLRLAEKYNLPKVIQEFITTHHGTGLVKYFYINYKNAHPDKEVDEAPFRYPGPNPWTREQAILMMCDTVEAASRSLSEYTEESISNLVNKLIDSQVSSGFFTDCPITFRDIKIAKQILIERLMSIYHTRIQYPELKTK